MASTGGGVEAQLTGIDAFDDKNRAKLWFTFDDPLPSDKRSYSSSLVNGGLSYTAYYGTSVSTPRDAAPYITTGRMGRAMNFTGSPSGTFVVNDPIDARLTSATGKSVSFTFWINIQRHPTHTPTHEPFQSSVFSFLMPEDMVNDSNNGRRQQEDVYVQMTTRGGVDGSVVQYRETAVDSDCYTVWTAAGRDALTLFPTDQWVHAVLTFDDTTETSYRRLYVDGVEVPLTASIPARRDNRICGNRGQDCDRLTLGGELKNSAGGVSLSALIDDFQVYSTVLTGSMVSTLYDAPKVVSRAPSVTPSGLHMCVGVYQGLLANVTVAFGSATSACPSLVYIAGSQSSDPSYVTRRLYYRDLCHTLSISTLTSEGGFSTCTGDAEATVLVGTLCTTARYTAADENPAAAVPYITSSEAAACQRITLTLPSSVTSTGAVTVLASPLLDFSYSSYTDGSLTEVQTINGYDFWPTAFVISTAVQAPYVVHRITISTPASGIPTSTWTPARTSPPCPPTGLCHEIFNVSAYTLQSTPPTASATGAAAITTPPSLPVVGTDSGRCGGKETFAVAVSFACRAAGGACSSGTPADYNTRITAPKVCATVQSLDAAQTRPTSSLTFSSTPAFTNATTTFLRGSLFCGKMLLTEAPNADFDSGGYAISQVNVTATSRSVSKVTTALKDPNPPAYTLRFTPVPGSTTQAQAYFCVAVNEAFPGVSTIRSGSRDYSVVVTATHSSGSSSSRRKRGRRWLHSDGTTRRLEGSSIATLTATETLTVLGDAEMTPDTNEREQASVDGVARLHVKVFELAAAAVAATQGSIWSAMTMLGSLVGLLLGTAALVAMRNSLFVHSSV